jgi:hypothetical protein
MCESICSKTQALKPTQLPKFLLILDQFSQVGSTNARSAALLVVLNLVLLTAEV